MGRESGSEGGRERGCGGRVEQGERRTEWGRESVYRKRSSRKSFPPPQKKNAPPKGKIPQRDISFFVISNIVEDSHFPAGLQVVKTAFK